MNFLRFSRKSSYREPAHVFRENSMKVRVVVDGKEIPINEFVNQILGGTISGAVMSLKGVDKDWGTIEIKVERDRD